MKKFTLLFVCLVMLGVQLVNAQQRTITGMVTSSDDGMALPGVSVSVKGTTLGTITNVEGKYSIDVPADAQALVFSFVGMKTKEVVLGTTTVIDVVMEPEVIGVDEVVVTALGISREKKSLGYAVQEVGGEDISAVKNDNFMKSMSGKVSGVQVKNTGNFGGSTNVIIRGSASLTGNNQALFVVDGIPLNNAITNNTGQTTGRSGYDYGNAAADINPNDIESVNVLKGAAATALYGSRAANGVVMITTKKGGKGVTPGKALGVTLNSNVTIGVIDKSTFPKYQSNYGAGYGPYYSGGDHPGLEEFDLDGDGADDLVVPFYEDASMGEKFDSGLLVYQWDALDIASPNYGKKTPWVFAGDNGPISFFNNSVSYTNSVDINGSTDKSQFRLGYTNMDLTDIMPNSSLKRNNYIFNGGYNVTDKLKVSASANYINTKGKGRPSTGYSDNIMSSFRQWMQTNVDYTMQKTMFDKTHRNVSWNPSYYDDATPIYWDNPYWVRYKNYETDERNRLLAFTQVDYSINDNISLMGRASVDTYSELQEERKAIGSVAGELGVDRPDVTSGYSRYTHLWTETNLDFLIKFNKSLSENFGVNAFLGTNIRRSNDESVFESTNGGLSLPELYALSNSVDAMLPPQEKLEQIGVNGVFGSVSFDFMRKTIFLDATIRRDVSSTLPSDNAAYFYPSVSTSFVFSNLIDQSWLQFGKIRLNYAEVGNDAPALSVKDTYVQAASYSGNAVVSVPNDKNNANLKPERTKNLEGGLEMNFFQSRLGFDVALYKTNTVDQIMPVSVSFASGYSRKYVNSGEVENKGVELSLNVIPVKTSDFKWNIGLNWAKNTNEVKSLAPGVENLQIASLQGGVTINARVGEPYGTIQGTDYVYNDDGSKQIGADGYYVRSSTSDKIIGHVTPDWNAGINNALSYKDFTFSFLIDWQQGGSIFSLDQWYGMATGLYAETDFTNDLGNPVRNSLADGGGIILPGELADGTVNTKRVAGNDYRVFGYSKNPNSAFVYDATYIKLREVTLTYNLPKKLMERTFIYGASVSFVGSNLWILSKDLPHADPEASQGAGNIQGWQSGVMPSSRQYGFSINLQF